MIPEVRRHNNLNARKLLRYVAQQVASNGRAFGTINIFASEKAELSHEEYTLAADRLIEEQYADRMAELSYAIKITDRGLKNAYNEAELDSVFPLK